MKRGTQEREEGGWKKEIEETKERTVMWERVIEGKRGEGRENREG